MLITPLQLAGSAGFPSGEERARRHLEGLLWALDRRLASFGGPHRSK
jgi:hypothetical protein